MATVTMVIVITILTLLFSHSQLHKAVNSRVMEMARNGYSKVMLQKKQQ